MRRTRQGHRCGLVRRLATLPGQHLKELWPTELAGLLDQTQINQIIGVDPPAEVG